MKNYSWLIILLTVSCASENAYSPKAKWFAEVKKTENGVNIVVTPPDTIIEDLENIRISDPERVLGTISMPDISKNIKFEYFTRNFEIKNRDGTTKESFDVYMNEKKNWPLSVDEKHGESVSGNMVGIRVSIVAHYSLNGKSNQAWKVVQMYYVEPSTLLHN